MSTVLKCDITGETGVLMLKADKQTSKRMLEDEHVFILEGEQLDYAISCHNQNSFNAKDVSELYVLTELHRLTVERMNEINDENTPKPTNKTDVTEL